MTTYKLNNKEVTLEEFQNYLSDIYSDYEQWKKNQLINLCREIAVSSNKRKVIMSAERALRRLENNLSAEYEIALLFAHLNQSNIDVLEPLAKGIKKSVIIEEMIHKEADEMLKNKNKRSIVGIISDKHGIPKRTVRNHLKSHKSGLW